MWRGRISGCCAETPAGPQTASRLSGLGTTVSRDCKSTCSPCWICRMTGLSRQQGDVVGFGLLGHGEDQVAGGIEIPGQKQTPVRMPDVNVAFA